MKLKKIIAALLAAAVAAASCVQAYAVNVPLTEDSPGAEGITTSGEPNSNSDPNQDDGEGSETWIANPVYDEETGFLTWDEYPGAKDAKYVTYSAVINDGECDTYTMYLSDRAACLPFYVAKQSQEGEEGEPWTINGDCEVRIVADPCYENEATDDTDVITSLDCFCYTFNGGTINPDLPIPVVTEGTLGSTYEQSDGVSAVSVHVVFQEGTYGNIGVLYKLIYNGIEQMDCDYGIYRTCPEGQDHYCCYANITPGETDEVYVQACSVGIDGSQSEWSEPYLLVDKTEHWEANFVYDESTGILMWDEFPDVQQNGRYDVTVKNDIRQKVFSIRDEPYVNLAVLMASMDLESEFSGTIKVDVRAVSLSADVYSSDSFSIEYDGCDINSQLSIPTNIKNFGGSSHLTIWDDVDKAVGYVLMSEDGQRIVEHDCKISPDDCIDFLFDDKFAVCSIDCNGDRSEWSELVSDSYDDPNEGEEPESWDANFSYNEDTGILSWDDIINFNEELSYNININAADCDWSTDLIGDSSGLGGWGDLRLGVPNINLPLCLTILSYGSDFSGEMRVSVTAIRHSDLSEVAYRSSDSFTFTYDGRDVNPDLEAPSLNVNGTKVTWNAVEGAVGYFYSEDRETVFGFNAFSDSVNEFTLTDETSSIAVCSVDKNGDISEWSEIVSASGNDPDPDLPEGSWKANFSYIEETGYLSWKSPAAVIDSGISSVDYSVIINDSIELSYTDFSLTYGGSPSYNLPLGLARCNAANDEIPSGELNIKVRLDTKVDFIKEPVCVDSFSYTFGGETNHPGIGVPEITDVKAEPATEESIDDFSVTITCDKIEGAVGYLCKLDGDDTVYTAVDDYMSGIKNWWMHIKDDAPSLRVCAVDKRGNTGKWSEPFAFTPARPGTWQANFTYNEETGYLFFDGCKDAEKKAENNIRYDLAIYYQGDFPYNRLYTLGYAYSFRQSDGSFSLPSISLPMHFSRSDLANGKYEIRAWVAYIDYKPSEAVSDRYYSEDGFDYEFKGGHTVPELVVPEASEAAAVVTNGFINDGMVTDSIELVFTANGISKEAKAAEYILTVNFENIEYTVNFGSTVFTGAAPDSGTVTVDSFSGWAEGYEEKISKATVKVRIIDLDGNKSEWSEPVIVELKENKIEEDGYYHFNYVNKAVGMSIAANQYNNNALGAAYSFNMYIPGVQLGKTTVGELKEICKGIKINDYGIAGCSVPGLTADDFFTSIVVQTDKDGAMYDGWNDTYDTLSFDFGTDIKEKDDQIVRNFMFQIGIRAEAIERAELKAGNYLVVYLGKPAEVNGNTFTYVDNEDGLTITGGTIKNPNVTIPAEIDGKPVTEIGMNAFAFNSNIETLIIPENVKRIGWYAFNTCENLTEATLPESLEYIDDWAFERCSSLKTVTVPKNTSHVGSGAFAQNTSMTSINCDPANGAYVSVDGVLFTKDMKELTAYPCGRSGSYTVPESVNHIGNAAFYGAKKLSAVEISGTLDFIGFEAFAECELLNNVNINDGVNYVGYWAFRGCTGIKQLTVPQSVTNIGDQAFGFRYADNKYDDFSLRGYKDSSVYYYAVRHDIPFVIIGDADKENSPFKEENAVEEPVAADPSKAEEDSITSITINPAFNMKNKNEAGVGIDLTKIKIKAEEIYQDEESIRRAEEALGDVIKGNKHYNLLDLTLLYDGEDFSDGYDGLVEVIIPIPAGHRDKEFYCYRIVDNNGTPEKELIPGKRVEDSYIIYLEHFSTYAFVGDGDHEHSFGKNWESDGVNHWHECSCGEISDMAAHTASEPITENGVKYTECTVCGRILSRENVSGTDTPETPSNPPSESGSGTFVSPDTTTEPTAAESSPETTAPSPETTAPQASADNTDTPSDGTSQGSASDNSAASSDNNTDGNANGSAGGNTGSADNAGNTSAEDKNQNTGVTLAVIPVLAAAAGMIFSKKRK